MGVREFGVGERQHQPPFDEPLLVGHPRELPPEAGLGHHRAQRRQQRRTLGAHRLRLLEVRQPAVGAEPGVAQGRGAGLLLGQQGRDDPGPGILQPVLQGGQQRRPQAQVPPGGMQRDPQHPGPAPVHPTHRRAHQVPVGHRDDARILRLQRGDEFREPEDGGPVRGGALTVEPHHRFEIVRSEVPNVPHRHTEPRTPRFRGFHHRPPTAHPPVRRASTTGERGYVSWPDPSADLRRSSPSRSRSSANSNSAWSSQLPTVEAASCPTAPASSAMWG